MSKKNRTTGRLLPVIAVTLGAVLAGISLAGCSKKSAAAAKSAALEPFTILAESNVLTAPLVTIAKEKGYFKEEGLAVEYVVLSSGKIEALSIGKGDVILTGIIPSLSFGAQGAPVRIIAGTASGGNFVLARPENAAALRDLTKWKGKRLGTVRLSTSEMITRYSLGQLGYSMKGDIKDVTFVEIDTYPNIIEAVRKGAVDVGFIASEYKQPAIDLGLEILFPMTNMFENYVCCRQTVNADALANRRSAFVKYLQAQIRAYKDLQENEDEIVRLLAKASSQEESFVRNFLYNKENNANRVFNPDPDLKRVSYVYDTLKTFDYVEKRGVETTDIVDTTVYKEALDAILARYPGDKIYRQLAEYFKENNPA
jgi:NitT/TauT family transport system substrate-binding protein